MDIFCSWTAHMVWMHVAKFNPYLKKTHWLAVQLKECKNNEIEIETMKNWKELK